MELPKYSRECRRLLVFQEPPNLLSQEGLLSIVRFYWTCSSNQQGGFCTNGTPFGLGRTFPLQWVLRALSHAWPFLESEERAESHSEAVYESSPDGPYLF